jgi:thiamine pyrophosphate-dependent acetolactate synthase large subunit-like protein
MDTVGILLRAGAEGGTDGTDAGSIADEFDRVEVPAAMAYALGLDPDQDPAGHADALPDGRLVVLAGPGVVGTRSVDGLRAFAAAANVPIANTWGAKGILPWDSPHHMGTCGLQARDFELLDFASYDAIIATGTDLAESPEERFGLAPIVDIPPTALGRLADQVTPAREPIRSNDLYTRLSAVAQPGYGDDRVPLHPARAVADVRAAAPAGGVIVGDPGVAGLWVARTFPTTEPGTIVVPATPTAGIAAALALVAALRGLPAVAVTTEPLDLSTLGVLELATELGAALAIDVGGSGGPVRRADDHLEHLHAAAREPGVTIVDVPVDLSFTRELVDAAGPVVAWGGLPRRV